MATPEAWLLLADTARAPGPQPETGCRGPEHRGQDPGSPMGVVARAVLCGFASALPPGRRLQMHTRRDSRWPLSVAPVGGPCAELGLPPLPTLGPALHCGLQVKCGVYGGL